MISNLSFKITLKLKLQYSTIYIIKLYNDERCLLITNFYLFQFEM